MSLRRFALPLCFMIGCAQGVEDSGFTSFGSMTVTATSPTAGPTSAGTDTGDDSTGGADSEGSSAGPTSGVSATEDSADGSTTAVDPSTTANDTTTTNDDTTSDGSTTAVGGMEIDVQNHDGSCEDVVWCQDMNTMEGVGPHGFAECFTNVGLAPPFDVTEVRYRVGTLQNVPTTITLEVRQWTGNAPGAVIGSQMLGAGDVTIGQHTLALTNPVSVNASSFCVAISGNDAFAISRDDSNSVPNVAFVKADDCGLASYATLQSIAFPGNLCMAATIAN